MRTLGLIGGMSAESTVVYYQALNRLARDRLGGLHSAELVIRSVDFAPIAALQAEGDWAATGEVLAGHARALEGAGAEAILICANTMHLNYDEVAAAVGAPVIHIGDATGAALKARGVTKTLLLGTRFTMEKPFYAERLAALGIQTAIPEAAQRDRLHAIIYDELVIGVINPASRAEVLAMIEAGVAGGCDGIAFACTEIGLLLDVEAMPAPAVDTAIAHCEAAMEFALA
ncbi:MAG: amino acid racemase [Proteobacteria bacterium]|nr:amino acid racemase [Pseudomonadota bacterium]